MKSNILLLGFLLFFTMATAQNKVSTIDEATFVQVLEKQEKDYKLLFFWVPKCETIEYQFNETDALQKSLEKVVILPVSVVSTLKYDDDFHNRYYQKHHLGNSLEVQRKLENPYENFDTFKAKFVEKIGGKNQDAFYFLFDRNNNLVKDWEDLPKKEEIELLLK